MIEFYFIFCFVLFGDVMNILVCVSRVPDTASKIMVGSNGKGIDNNGIKYIVNPYDEFALEEALRLREKNGGTVTAVTVGTDAAVDVLRTSLAMGVDKAVLVKADENADSFNVAHNLAKVAREINPDLILMGRQSIDFDSFFMASTVAEMLEIGSASVVSKLTIDGNNVAAERDIEGGKETVAMTLPCIISCQKGLNDPRYPKLPDIMKAKSKPIETKDADAVAARTSVLGLEIPSKARAGVMLTNADEDLDKLVKLLHEDAKVI